MHIHKWGRWIYSTRRVHHYLMGEWIYSDDESVRYRICERCDLLKIKVNKG